HAAWSVSPCRSWGEGGVTSEEGSHLPDARLHCCRTRCLVPFANGGAVQKALRREQHHVMVDAPWGLPEAAAETMHRTLGAPHLRTQLRRAVPWVVLEHPSLPQVKVNVTS